MADQRVCNADLYAEVAEELGVPIGMVKAVLKSQAEFTESIIRKGAFEGVSYPFLGKIKAKHKKVMLLNQLKGDVTRVVGNKSRDKTS